MAEKPKGKPKASGGGGGPSPWGLIIVIIIIASALKSTGLGKKFLGTDTASSTPNAISSWQIHTSNDFGIVFEYPRNWQVKEKPLQIDIISPDSEVISMGGRQTDCANLKGSVERCDEVLYIPVYTSAMSEIVDNAFDHITKSMKYK